MDNSLKTNIFVAEQVMQEAIDSMDTARDFFNSMRGVGVSSICARLKLYTKDLGSIRKGLKKLGPYTEAEKQKIAMTIDNYVKNEDDKELLLNTL